ncbi:MULTISPECIES: FadR/GntR family transcriptional regulator [unclassified Iodidimonas]|jgi:DNA-binding FadR family transcriptional regulator|uniref:FadR/GntR family transcriptional regulator n=1 Tax=unclassified Iodidimonas TaxID=2626145 RepID=UPI00248320EF|nr:MULTISPECIES: FadR/GntR family transcriptional regulator [unclassified Iodidimonas]
MQNHSGRNLTYVIVHDLGRAIVKGHYDQHNPFPIEAALCTQYGASRSVLREAVKMLTAKGLLRARPRQGTWIEPEENWNLLDPDVLQWLLERKYSPQLLVEFTEMRLAFEPVAAALAAQRCHPEDIQNILAALDRMREAEKGNDDPLSSDIAFHVSILNACGNRFYAQLKGMINTALRISIRLTNQRKGVPLASIRDHKKVVDAIIARDPEAASEAMRALIIEAMMLIQQSQADELQKAASIGSSTKSAQ